MGIILLTRACFSFHKSKMRGITAGASRRFIHYLIRMPQPEPGGSAGDFAGQVLQGMDSEHAAEIDARSKDEKEKPEATEPPGTEEGHDEPVKPDAVEPDPTEPPAATYKIGDREFTSVEDVVKEANRINGHNADVSGKFDELTTRAETAEADRDKVLAMNQRWKEYFDAQESGESGKRPDLDPDHIAEVTAQRISAKQSEDSLKAEIAQQVEHLESLENYDEVVEIVENCAECVNPVTGKLYTLRDAYAFACKQLGQKDLWDEEETPAPPVEAAPVEAAPAEPPKPAPKNPIKSGAARPSGSRGGGAPAKKAPGDEFVDRAIAEALPFGL
jgi:hypothetical protein